MEWLLLISSVVGMLFPAQVSPVVTFASSVPSIIFIENVLFVGQASPGVPVRLRIPVIGVNAVVGQVGLTAQGAVDVPKGPTEAAWFYLGPRPGEKGSAVIDGHSGWKNRIPAVFDNLYLLHEGDKIYIEDTYGAIMTFVVRELRQYRPNADASEVFESDDGNEHLNLITCGGAWNATQKTYSSRLVVFTDKVIE